jgi:hypothetical protein
LIFQSGFGWDFIWVKKNDVQGYCFKNAKSQEVAPAGCSYSSPALSHGASDGRRKYSEMSDDWLKYGEMSDVNEIYPKGK